MKTDEIKIRVRYAETDQMGFVYHGNYPLYFDMGRTEWLRKLGISYKVMEDSGIILPVVSLSIQYKNPIRYDDQVYLKTTLKKKPTASIVFDYEIADEQRTLLTTASTTLVFVDKETKRSVRVPQYVLDAIER